MTRGQLLHWGQSQLLCWESQAGILPCKFSTVLPLTPWLHQPRVNQFCISSLQSSEQFCGKSKSCRSKLQAEWDYHASPASRTVITPRWFSLASNPVFHSVTQLALFFIIICSYFWFNSLCLLHPAALSWVQAELLSPSRDPAMGDRAGGFFCLKPHKMPPVLLCWVRFRAVCYHSSGAWLKKSKHFPKEVSGMVTLPLDFDNAHWKRA